MFTYSTTFLQDNPNLKIWKIDFFDSPKIFENVKKFGLNLKYFFAPPWQLGLTKLYDYSLYIITSTRLKFKKAFLCIFIYWLNLKFRVYWVVCIASSSILFSMWVLIVLNGSLAYCGWARTCGEEKTIFIMSQKYKKIYCS